MPQEYLRGCETLLIIILDANDTGEKQYSYKDVQNLFNQKYGK